MDLSGQIKNEISVALERLGAQPQLLAVVGSWGDTLDDETVLQLLREWNAGTFRFDSLVRKPKLRIVR
jgi:hypothetical protein